MKWITDEGHDCRTTTRELVSESESGMPGLLKRTRTVNLPLGASDGFRSYYALPVIAERDRVLDKCLEDPLEEERCLLPRRVPEEPGFVVGIDRNAPTVVAKPGGLECDGAPGGDKCLVNRSVATLDLDVSESGSGIASVRCRGVGTTFLGIPAQPCKAGGNVIRLGGFDGVQAMEVEVRDVAGHKTTITSKDSEDFDPWIVDRRAPVADAPQVDPKAGPSGFLRREPEVTVSARETSLFSSGLREELTVRIDGEDHPCTAELTDGGRRATCTVPEELVPDQGVHTVTVIAHDRAGNDSAESAEAVVRVDSQAPTTRLVLEPAEPDGEDDVFRTPPSVGFATSDGLAGSGVDLADPDGGVDLRIDDGPLTHFDPDDPVAQTLGDGTHTVCFRATDRAGNVEEGDGPDGLRCGAPVRVDSTAPTVVIELDPEQPGGLEDHHVARPTARVRAQDEGTEPTGLASSELRLDGGAWTSADAIEIPDGVHVVEARARDLAATARRWWSARCGWTPPPRVQRSSSSPPRPTAWAGSAGRGSSTAPAMTRSPARAWRAWRRGSAVPRRRLRCRWSTAIRAPRSSSMPSTAPGWPARR